MAPPISRASSKQTERADRAMCSFVVLEKGTASQKASYAQVIAVDAALLRTGRIVYFSG